MKNNEKEGLKLSDEEMKKEFEKITLLLKDHERTCIQKEIISCLDQQGITVPTLKSFVYFRG